MKILSSLVIPLMVLGIVIYGIFKKVDVYDTFIDGSKESFDMVLTLFPCLLAMILGVNLFTKSGLLPFLLQWFDPIFKILKVPSEIFPMALMRPISGSSTLALLNNVFTNYGPDSFIGRVASIIQGSTDTTFYIITLYFGSVGIKKVKYALWAGLLADLAGIIASIFIATYFFG